MKIITAILTAALASGMNLAAGDFNSGAKGPAGSLLEDLANSAPAGEVPVPPAAAAQDAAAGSCPDISGKYGADKSYQDMFCMIKVMADATDSMSNRSLLFTDAGLIQVFNNFHGRTSSNSDSTGARVYYLFPIRMKKEISSVDESHISVTHPSGVRFDFDKDGKLSSPDLEVSVSKDINSANKSGIEIGNLRNGLVVDLGYRIGNTPTLNKNAIVTVTDKNKRKCDLENSEFNKIQKGEAELIYKTNKALHGFLARRCPGLDISDLLDSNSASMTHSTGFMALRTR